MRIAIDRDACVGSGMCVLIEPAVFDQNDDDGLVELLDEGPLTDTAETVEDAVQRCPAAALRVTPD
ncbi:ferredoxin [Streptomyces sp. DSM 41527]|uniref:Ferredoxin n=1 Tax=Streptomyces mooreae TaxID=3075523 RepID=A0ABU2SZG2_9ACTN|nr:ferredoxin [Streptomyces sp. DSM 41527]MDT0454128.1 ferredoxin [Streptomyces sp. DSM 41527]